MCEPFETSKWERCGKIIAEPKELSDFREAMDT